MNITELEKIIAQIKKYQLEDEIRDIECWLENLNEKQIRNFLSLKIYPTEQIKYKFLLVNKIALNSDYYLEDIKLVTNDKSEEVRYCLASVVLDENSLESEHHREDMNLIAHAKSYKIASCLSAVAMDKNSLKSKHHREDMKRLANAKSDVHAEIIYNNINKQREPENNYITFQERIDAIHQNAIEYTDGDTTKELNDSVFTLK